MVVAGGGVGPSSIPAKMSKGKLLDFCNGGANVKPIFSNPQIITPTSQRSQNNQLSSFQKKLDTRTKKMAWTMTH